MSDVMTPATDALGIVGTLFKGVASFIGAGKRAQAERNAAEQAENEAGVAAQLQLGQGDQIAAQAAVQGAANGGGLVGSTIGVISSLSQQAVFNARAAAYKGQSEARAHIYKAGVATASGNVALINAGVEAATQAASAFAGIPVSPTSGASLTGADASAQAPLGE